MAVETADRPLRASGACACSCPRRFWWAESWESARPEEVGWARVSCGEDVDGVRRGEARRGGCDVDSQARGTGVRPRGGTEMASRGGWRWGLALMLGGVLTIDSRMANGA